MFLKELIFDNFLKKYNPYQKIFLSHLLMEIVLIDNGLPKIYTTKTLATQLIYLHTKKLTLVDNFVIITPYKPILFKLSDGTVLEVLAVESDDISRTVMYLIKENNRVKYLYAPFCKHVLRPAILNDTFVEWLKHGVEKLFMNLSRCNEKENNDGEYNAIDEIESLLESNPEFKIEIYLPLFGYENFINDLARRLRCCVALVGTLHGLFRNLCDMKIFQNDLNKARIFISTVRKSNDEMNNANRSKIIMIELKENPLDEFVTRTNSCGYYQLKWTPISKPFYLKLLAILARPYEILHTNRNHVELPGYLKNLCSKYNSDSKAEQSSKEQSTQETNLPQKPVEHESTQKREQFVKQNQKTSTTLSSSSQASEQPTSSKQYEIKKNQQKCNTSDSPIQSRGKALSKEAISPDEKTSDTYRRRKHNLRYLEDSDSD